MAAGASCTISVDVTSSTVGSEVNTIPASALTSDQGATNTNPGSATLTVDNATDVTVTKAFAATTIGPNGTSVLTITVANTGVTPSALTGLALSDALPAGVTIAATPHFATTCAAGTVTGAAGGSSVGLTGGTLAASATCIITATVTGATPGSYVNTIPTGDVTTTQGATNGAPATATLTIAPPVTITKSFSPTTIVPGGISTMTIGIANTAAGSVSLTGVALTDTFPANLTIAATPNATTTCGGTLTAVAGSGSLGLSGGGIAPSASCTITVDVTSTTVGSEVNTIPANALTSDQGATNTNPGTATLTVNDATDVTLTKAFSPVTIAAGGVSTLTISIANTSGGSSALTALAVSDTLPAGISIAATPNASTTCGAGAVTGAAGGTTIALSGGSVASGATCTISIAVTGVTPNAYLNTIAAGSLTSAQGATNGSPASATLTIAPPVTVSKAFSPSTIAQGGTSTLTVTIANTAAHAVALTGLGLTDALPVGVTIAATPAGVTACGGSITATAGASSFGIAAGALAAGATCTFSASVTAAVAGSYVNTIPASSVTTNEGASNGAPATATLTVAPPVSITKSFSPTSIVPGGTSTMTIGIQNLAAGSVALTGVGLTDTFPANLTIAATPNATTTCGGAVTAVAGAASIALASGSIAAGTSCTITVAVTSTVLGAHVNTIPAGALVTDQGTSNGSPVSATVTVNNATDVTLSKAFSPVTIGPGGTSTLTITIANTGAGSSSLTGLALADALPSGITIAATPNATTTCPSGHATGAAGGTSVGLTGGTLASGATCTISIAVTGTIPNAYVNTIPAGSVTGDQGATNGAPATATLTIAPPVTVTKAFSPASIPQHGSSVLTITIANTAAHAVALSGLALADTLPANVTIAATPNATTTCGGASSATAGGASVALSGGALAANASCTISVAVTSITIGSYLNTIPAGAVSTNEGATNGAPATATLVVTASAKLSVSKSFTPAIIPSGGTSLLSITIANADPAAVALTGVAFTDTMPAGTTIGATPNATTTCAGGTATATAGGTTVALSGGAMAVGATCTVTVNVTGTVLGSYVNTIPAGGVTSNEGSVNGAPATATLTVGAPNLTVTKTSNPQNSSVAPGQTIVYTIAVKNNGSIAETNTKLTDTPSNATLVTGSVTLNGAAAADAIVASGQTIGTLAPGATDTVAYSATVSSTATTGTIVSNNVVVGGDQPCSGPTCSASPPPNTVSVPQLSVGKLIDGMISEIVVPGQRVTYTIAVANTGATIAAQAVLTDPVPAGIMPVAGTVTLNGAPASGATVVGQTVTVPLGDLAPGDRAAVGFGATIMVASSTPIINVVQLNAVGLHTQLFSNQVTANSVTPAIVVTKTTPATVVNSGDRVDYTITLRGTTGVPYGATVATDTLPDYEIYAPGTARANGQPLEPTVNGHRLTWTFAHLNGTITITYAVAIGNGAPPNGTLANVVDVVAQTVGQPGRGTASATVRVLGTPFGSCFPITGRVYLDLAGSGRFEDGDTGIAGVTVYLDDGESVVTDQYGRYNFPCVRPGMHALRLDDTTLPDGMHPFDDHNIDSEKSIRRLVHRTFDATIIEDINFAIQPDPKK
jgi:uncharacterized repeat protein (TIGR01451 family)